jgi:hypothetical protein
MSIESIQIDNGSPSTPIPIIVNDTPLTPSTTMVVVLKVPIITHVCPIVHTQPITLTSFGSIGHSPGYNIQSIPMASSPFSYGMPNFTSQFSSSIPTTSPHTSIALGGMAPSHTPFSFSGVHIPQTIPPVGGLPPFHPGSNPSSNAPRWSNQPGGQDTAHIPSLTPTSSIPILTNTFGMKNPPLSSKFTPRGGQFHSLGNPQSRATPVGGNVYILHQNIPTGMVPNQPFMNQLGSYNPGQGHGAYQNPRWVVIPQQQYFQRAWGQISQPRLPSMAMLNFLDLSKLMNNLVCHDMSWPPVPTKLPSNIPKFEGRTSEDIGNHVTTFHL